MHNVTPVAVAGNPTFSLPDRVRQVLAGLPFKGVHRWLYHAACTIIEETAIGDKDAAAMLYAATRKARRRVSRREITVAVADARRKCGGNTGKPAPAVFTKRWPDVDPIAIAAITKNGPALYDLWESSPCRFDDDHQHTEEIIDVLFPGDPLLCCGLTNAKFATRRRSVWRGHLSRLSLIVPNPMLSRNALTQDGRQSEHTKAGTAARVYLVIEFDRDELSLDMQAALHADLARRFPLVAAVFSGHESLHGWYFVCGQPPGDVRDFMRRAVALGADPVTWGRSQFSRMPDGRRDDGSRQTIFYFNPGGITLP